MDKSLHESDELTGKGKELLLRRYAKLGENIGKRYVSRKFYQKAVIIQKWAR